MLKKALLLAGLSAGTIAGPGEQEIFDGQISLTVPGNRQLDSIQFGVDFENLQSIQLTESQGAKEHDKMLQVGKKSVLTLKLNYKQKMRYRNAEMTNSEAVFYLFDDADTLKSVTIEPKYYTKGLEFHESGTTKPVFQMEVLEVDRVGDRDGRVIETFKDLALDIGKPNEIIMDVDVNRGRRLAVRLRAMDSVKEAHVIHLPSRTKGSYLAQYHDGIEEEATQVFNVPVTFQYVKKNTKAHRQRLRAFQMVADEINNYVRNSAYYGTPKVVEIPLKIRMKLAPEGVQAQKIIVGPPPGPSADEPANEDDSGSPRSLGF